MSNLNRLKIELVEQGKNSQVVSRVTWKIHMYRK